MVFGPVRGEKAGSALAEDRPIELVCNAFQEKKATGRPNIYVSGPYLNIFGLSSR